MMKKIVAKRRDKMIFNEREALKIRMQQIFLERKQLQDEYKELFSRLREIDERDSRQSSSKDNAPSKNLEQNKGVTEHSTEESNKSSKEWEDFELTSQEESTIDTKEYDKRLDELQGFLEAENE